MAYDNDFAALADPRRRAILEVVRQQPLSVGELAATQPVRRPAISQHLKVLAAANLVGVRQDGARHVWRLWFELGHDF
jgi:DNA-binding transcriptional ArsR family regulator